MLICPFPSGEMKAEIGRQASGGTTGHVLVLCTLEVEVETDNEETKN